MSNIIDYLEDGFDNDEEMETDDPPVEGRIVDIQSSESELEDLGDEIEEDSSVLDSSSLILQPGTMSHPLVLVEGTRLRGLCLPVCIPPPVLAVCMLMLVRSHLLRCAPSQISQ